MMMNLHQLFPRAFTPLRIRMLLVDKKKCSKLELCTKLTRRRRWREEKSEGEEEVWDKRGSEDDAKLLCWSLFSVTQKKTTISVWNAWLHIRDRKLWHSRKLAEDMEKRILRNLFSLCLSLLSAPTGCEEMLVCRRLLHQRGFPSSSITLNCIKLLTEKTSHHEHNVQIGKSTEKESVQVSERECISCSLIKKTISDDSTMRLPPLARYTMSLRKLRQLFRLIVDDGMIVERVSARNSIEAD